MRRQFFHTLIVGFVLFAFVDLAPAHAVTGTTMTSFLLTCTSFQISGETDAPYVQIYAYVVATGDEYYNIMAVNGQYEGQVTFPAVPFGTKMFIGVWGSPDATQGNYDGKEWFKMNAECGKAGYTPPKSVPGPLIPSGYTLHTITCDVAVFNTPNGSPVGEASLKSGQTWYVGSVDEAGWAPVFVGGPNVGYIPAACIQ